MYGAAVCGIIIFVETFVIIIYVSLTARAFHRKLIEKGRLIPAATLIIVNSTVITNVPVQRQQVQTRPVQSVYPVQPSNQEPAYENIPLPPTYNAASSNHLGWQVPQDLPPPYTAQNYPTK